MVKKAIGVFMPGPPNHQLAPRNKTSNCYCNKVIDSANACPYHLWDILQIRDMYSFCRF
jgi:hypothetical protein